MRMLIKGQCHSKADDYVVKQKQTRDMSRASLGHRRVVTGSVSLIGSFPEAQFQARKQYTVAASAAASGQSLEQQYTQAQSPEWLFTGRRRDGVCRQPGASILSGSRMHR